MSEIESSILKIQYDILKAIDDKTYITDKELLSLEQHYKETPFLSSFNALLGNYFVQSQPIAHNKSEDDINGAELQYSMTDKGKNLFKNLYEKHYA